MFSLARLQSSHIFNVRRLASLIYPRSCWDSAKMSTISLPIDMDNAQSTTNSSSTSIQETINFEGGEGSEHRVRNGEGRATGLYNTEHTVRVRVLSLAWELLLSFQPRIRLSYRYRILTYNLSVLRAC